MLDDKTTRRNSAGAEYRFDDLTTSTILADLHFRRDDPGPGDMVPAFDLATTDGGRLHSDDLGTQPVLMVFGSRTCPITESSGRHLNALHAKFGSSIRFAMVNTREAHPGEKITQPKTSEKKLEHAIALQAHHRFEFEVAVDDIDGTLHRALSPKPNSAYLLDPNGTILYRAHWANDHKSLEPALQVLVDLGTSRREKSRALVRPLLMAVGHLPAIVQDAGRKTGRDVWRAAPPLALLASISRIFTNQATDRRGRLAASALGLSAIVVTVLLSRW